MAMTVAEMQSQMASNSAQWAKATPDGKIYLHNANLQLQAQIDAATKTTTVYEPSTGTYHTVSTAPVGVINPTSAAVGAKVVNTSGVAKTGGFNAPAVAVGKNTPVIPTGDLHPAIVAAASDIDARKAYAANFTGWDNDPTLRSYQQASMDIYINTGRWDTAEQIQLHNQAEALRKSINLTYKGSADGTLNKAAADMLILPDSNPNLTDLQGSATGGIKNVLTGVTGANVGTALKLGGLAMGAMFIMSMFKGGHR